VNSREGFGCMGRDSSVSCSANVENDMYDLLGLMEWLTAFLNQMLRGMNVLLRLAELGPSGALSAHA
jgi:hypothetical protein